MTSPAWIEVTQEGGTLILRLCGELDQDTREILEPAVMAAVPTAEKVVLDLGDLTFCDSSGLSMFLAAHDKAEANGHMLIIGNIPPNIAHLLKVTGIEHALNVTE
jgi:anti-sigma B factor antagonist